VTVSVMQPLIRASGSWSSRSLAQWRKLRHKSGGLHSLPLPSLPPFPPPFPPFPSLLSPALEVGPLKSNYGVWGSAVSSPSGVWGGAPAEIDSMHYCFKI